MVGGRVARPKPTGSKIHDFSVRNGSNYNPPPASRLKMVDKSVKFIDVLVKN
jgi:hypothetical protein